MATMSPSDTVLSSGQIEKLLDVARAALRKAAPGLPGEPSQDVIEKQGEEIAKNLVTDFRTRVESKMTEVVRRVKVDRTLKPMDVINATGRTKYVNDSIVATMPDGEGDEVDVVFFKPDASEYTRSGYISDDDLAKALKKRGLTPDPRAQAKVNEEDPAFADERPNGTHWKDGDRYNFATFYRWGGKRRVHVDRDGGGWRGDWWFAGVRK